MRISRSCKSAGKIFVDEFRDLRKSYQAPKYPILLCHGLLGFDHIKLPTGHKLSYFNGVKEALEAYGARVIARSVPPMGSIELRANALYQSLQESSDIGKIKHINIIAHSMGGLDSRFMISQLMKGTDALRVASLTTLSTPHRGSPIANLFDPVTKHFPANYGAFSQLTTQYVTDEFNKKIKNVDDVHYFSYGAKFKPTVMSPFFLFGEIIQRTEGDNDGLVSVESSKWGEYLGTLDNVDHGDVINMTRLKPRRLLNHNYSSQAMYLHIMDNLAKLGF